MQQQQQQQQQQQPYYPQQSRPEQYSISQSNQPSSVGQWVISLLLCMIPIVNIVLLCVWGFGSSGKDISKKNWAKAQLIITAIIIILEIIMFAVLGSQIANVIDMLSLE